MFTTVVLFFFFSFFCRRPITKKLAAAVSVKQEHVSDVDLSSAYQQPKGKNPARLGSPIVITDDESGSDQNFDTPKAKGRPNPKALEKDQRYLPSVRSRPRCV